MKKCEKCGKRINTKSFFYRREICRICYIKGCFIDTISTFLRGLGIYLERHGEICGNCIYLKKSFECPYCKKAIYTCPIHYVRKKEDNICSSFRRDVRK